MAGTMKALLILGVVAALFVENDARIAHRRLRNVNKTEEAQARYGYNSDSSGDGHKANSYNCQGYYDCMGRMEGMSKQLSSLKAEQSTLMATMTSVNKKALEQERMLSKLVPQNKRLRHELEHLSEEYEEAETALIEKINQIANMEEEMAKLRRVIEEIIGMCTRLISEVDEDDIEYGNYGIYYISPAGTTKTWWEAQNYCRQNGMDLVSIESSDEQDEINSYIEEFYTTPSNTLWFWIGLNNYETANDVYQWIGTGFTTEHDHSDHDFEYDNWGFESPSTDVLNCVGMYDFDEDTATAGPDGIAWYDLDCGTPNRFICEVPPICQYLLELP